MMYKQIQLAKHLLIHKHTHLEEQRGMNKSFHLHFVPKSPSLVEFEHSRLQCSPRFLPFFSFHLFFFFAAPLLPSFCFKPSCLFSWSILDFSSDHVFYAGL